MLTADFIPHRNQIMIQERKRLVPNLETSHWDPSDPPMATPLSPFPIHGFAINFNGNATGGDYPPSIDSATTLHRFLSNDFTASDFDTLCEDFDMPFDAFSSNHFRMYEFKVRKCPRARSHDWTECPYAHPGEKARRRDPRKYHYSGTACPEFRKGICKRGDSCEFAHGVFESWLHPARYRTQLCKDGTSCRRRVCFFAHTPEQLRVLTHGSGESLDGSPIRLANDSSWSTASFVSSPTSVLNSSPICTLSDSPPTSPENLRYGGGSFNAMSQIITSMRNVQLDKVASARGSQMGSPCGANLRPGSFSLPSTPTRTNTKSRAELWDRSYEEEPTMERVESGRDLRAKIYARLSKENSFGRTDTGFSAPDFGWVSELVK